MLLRLLMLPSAPPEVAFLDLVLPETLPSLVPTWEWFGLSWAGPITRGWVLPVSRAGLGCRPSAGREESSAPFLQHCSVEGAPQGGGKERIGSHGKGK